MNSEALDSLVMSLDRRSYRSEVQSKTAQLTKEMASLLGAKERRLFRILPAVVDAISNKLFVERIITGNEFIDTEIRRWLKVNRFDNLQRDLWRAVVRDGEAFVLTSYQTDGVGTGAPKYQLVEAYDGHTGAQYVYSATDRETPQFAVNLWYEGTTRRLDVYYPGKIEMYRRGEGESFWNLVEEVDWTDTNGAPLGIALVKYDIGTSDVTEAVQIQRDINEAVVDLLAISRAMGFPQRYTSGKINPDFIVNQFGQPVIDPLFAGPIKKDFVLTPGSIPHFNEGTTLGQLDGAKADSTVIDKLLHLLSVVTTVPTFYFNGGEMPSGVALVQAEQRLNTKVEGHQGSLTPGIEELIRLSARLSNTFGATALGATALSIGDMTVEWASPEVYTVDLQLELEKAAYTKIILLKEAGLISIDEAVKALHPDWDEARIQAEVLRLQTGDSVL